MRSALEAEFELWSAEGLTACFWLRDDDAVSVTPALETLATIGRRYDIDIGLAVIPQQLGADLIASLREPATCFYAMCHGFDHINHGTDERPGEFGDERSASFIESDLVHARSLMDSKLGIACPMFVPPFGRINSVATTALQRLGFRGLSNQNSRYLNRLVRLAGAQSLPPYPSRRTLWPATLDAQIDVISWPRRTAREAEAIDARLLGELRLRRKGYRAHDTPIGLLGHHLIHDQLIWTSLERLIERLKRLTCVAFPPIDELCARYQFMDVERKRAS